MNRVCQTMLHARYSIPSGSTRLPHRTFCTSPGRAFPPATRGSNSCLPVPFCAPPRAPPSALPGSAATPFTSRLALRGWRSRCTTAHLHTTPPLASGSTSPRAHTLLRFAWTDICRTFHPCRFILLALLSFLPPPCAGSAWTQLRSLLALSSTHTTYLLNAFAQNDAAFSLLALGSHLSMLAPQADVYCWRFLWHFAAHAACRACAPLFLPRTNTLLISPPPQRLTTRSGITTLPPSTPRLPTGRGRVRTAHSTTNLHLYRAYDTPHTSFPYAAYRATRCRRFRCMPGCYRTHATVCFAHYAAGSLRFAGLLPRLAHPPPHPPPGFLQILVRVGVRHFAVFLKKARGFVHSTRNATVLATHVARIFNVATRLRYRCLVLKVCGLHLAWLDRRRILCHSGQRCLHVLPPCHRRRNTTGCGHHHARILPIAAVARIRGRTAVCLVVMTNRFHGSRHTFSPRHAHHADYAAYPCVATFAWHAYHLQCHTPIPLLRAPNTPFACDAPLYDAAAHDDAVGRFITATATAPARKLFHTTADGHGRV